MSPILVLSYLVKQNTPKLYCQFGIKFLNSKISSNSNEKERYQNNPILQEARTLKMIDNSDIKIIFDYFIMLTKYFVDDDMEYLENKLKMRSYCLEEISKVINFLMNFQRSFQKQLPNYKIQILQIVKKALSKVEKVFFVENL